MVEQFNNKWSTLFICNSLYSNVFFLALCVQNVAYGSTMEFQVPLLEVSRYAKNAYRNIENIEAKKSYRIIDISKYRRYIGINFKGLKSQFFKLKTP